MSVLINSRGTLSSHFDIGSLGTSIKDTGQILPPVNANLTVDTTVGFGLSVNSGASYGLITTGTTRLKILAETVEINGLEYPSSPGASGQVLTSNGFGQILWASPAAAGLGTVTSVSGTGTVSGITLTGTVTESGQLTLGGQLSVTPSNFGVQAAGTVLAAPTGTNGNPMFRPLIAADIPVLNQDTTGTAAALTDARMISITGDAAWGVSFDGSGDTTAVLTLSDTGITPGAYTLITVDSKGRVIAGSNPNTMAGLGITDGVSITGATFVGALNFAEVLPVASASVIELMDYDANILRVTGTTDITSFGTALSGAVRKLFFEDTLVLVNGPGMALPGSADIQVFAGDTIELIGTNAGWRFGGIVRANTLPSGEFSQTGTGAVVRGITERMREYYRVTDYGATGTGTIDDTAAFSYAAAAAKTDTAASAGIPAAHTAVVYVPAGSYLLSGLVDTGNRSIIWEVDPGANIINQQFLNGEVRRTGQGQSGYHLGPTDFSCGYVVSANNGTAAPLGLTSAEELAQNGTRKTVGFYAENYAPPALVTASTATYTLTSVTVAPPDAGVVAKYRRGMIVDTNHTPKWAGVVDSWSTDGSVITVTGWFSSSSGTIPGTPADGVGCVLNGYTTINAHSAKIVLAADSFATKATGFALSVDNNKSDLDYSNTQNYVVGYSAESNGAYDGAIGYLATNGESRFHTGFYSQDPLHSGFRVRGTTGAGFLSEYVTGLPFQHIDGGGTTQFYVTGHGSLVANGGMAVPTPSGSITLGSASIAGVPRVEFLTTGNGNAYDAKITAFGGGTLDGEAELAVIASGGVSFTGDVKPQTDSGAALGTASTRWSQIYAATDTINTSDYNEKQDIRGLTDAEQRVAQRLKTLVRVYRFRDAVAKKGDAARLHVGMIAQDVKQVFEDEGLDAEEYGVLCYDTWDEQAQEVNSWDAVYGDGGAVLSDAGYQVIKPSRTAGGRYGIRYNELYAFIISAL